MTWNRTKSVAEKLMVDVLRESEHALTLAEIVSRINAKNSSALRGKTPINSLYSIIYRREKRRIEQGKKSLFVCYVRGGASYYDLKKDDVEITEEKVKHK